MVGSNGELSKNGLTEKDYLIAGAASGFFTRFFIQPLDVIKIRFQLQVENRREGAKYTGIWQAVKTIAAEESIGAFWKGHVSGQLLSITFGTVQFGTFEAFTKYAQRFGHDISANFVCGATAGVTATIASFPFDVLRTRFVAQGNVKSYVSIRQSLRDLIKREGIRGSFRGLTPALLQAAPQSGTIFGFYHIFDDLLKPFKRFENNMRVSRELLVGSLAGLCSKTVVYPLDLARKRLQLQGFQSARQGFGKNFTCRGLLNCIWLTAIDEGFVALYKGLLPSLLKAALSTGIYFTAYEEFCRFIASISSIREK